MTWSLIGQFLLLTTIFSLVIIFLMHHFFIAGVEGAKQRLDRDAEAARAREAELNKKIRQADEELAQRKRQLDALEQKMKGDLESEALKHKEELIAKARSESEEIITKAQNAADGIRKDIEKQMEIRIVDHATVVLADVLTKKARVALDQDMVDEFCAQLKNVEMSKISSEIKQAEVVSATPLADADLKKITDIIRSKIGREMVVISNVAQENISGVVLKFGSLHLDGCLRAAIRDSAIALKVEIEKGTQKKE